MLTSTRYGILYPNPDRSDTADWPRDVGQLVTALEKSVMYGQGLFANRPAAAIQGRIYAATDKGKVYYDTGSSWFDLQVPHAASHAHDSTDPVTDYEYAFSNRKIHHELAAMNTSALTVGSYAMAHSGLLQAVSGNIIGAGNAMGWAIPFDPADYSAGTRATKVRVQGVIAESGTSSGTATFAFSLKQVTSISSGVVTLSNVVSTTPTTAGANAIVSVVSSEVNAPTAGLYILTVDIGTATLPGGATQQFGVNLQVRQI